MKHDFPNRIIFLDIDGVLSTARNAYGMWDSEAMNNLIKIIQATDAKIVVSSSWRNPDQAAMRKNFKAHGCPDEILDAIVGVTVYGCYWIKDTNKIDIVRGNEIEQFVKTHLTYPWYAFPECDGAYRVFDEDGSFKVMNSNRLDRDYTYLILDDDSDMLYDQRNHFIQTNAEVGITLSDAKRGIEILNKHLNP